MRRREPLSDTPSTRFNEGEFLKDFEDINEALGEEVRALEKKVPDEDSVSEQELEEMSASLEPDDSEDEGNVGEVPFTSVRDNPKSGMPRVLPDQPEEIIYKQARRGRKRRQGRRGIWRFLPHIGHRRRHWIQRHLAGIISGSLLVLLLICLIVWRYWPVMIQHWPPWSSPVSGANQAAQAHAERDYETAIQHYMDFLQTHNDNSEQAMNAHYYLGCCLEAIGEIDKAREEYLTVWQDFQRMIEKNQSAPAYPESAPVQLNLIYAHNLYDLGRISWQLEQYGQAKGYYEQLLTHFPNYVFNAQVQQRLSLLDKQADAVSSSPDTGGQDHDE